MSARSPLPLKIRIESRFLNSMLGVPPTVLRRLAGKPITIEGTTLDAEPQLMLRLDRLTGTPEMASVPIPQGRRIFNRGSRVIGGSLPIGAVEDLTAPGADGPLPARLYTPTSLVEHVETTPLLVYFHGGGWIYGDLDSHDGLCRFLAEQAGVKVLSVAYRLAPEAPFPDAVDDCAAAYAHIAAHAEDFGADPERLAVGGDSAGGNLAALIALDAAEKGLPLAFQLLIYPATDFSRTMPSQAQYGEGLILTEEFMNLAADTYLNGADEKDPRASVRFADVPAGVAPAYVAIAGFDVLRDEGEAYAHKLQDVGVAVEVEHFPDMLHGFVNVVGVGRTQRAAATRVGEALRRGLGS
jgi:acetyl esterase